MTTMSKQASGLSNGIGLVGSMWLDDEEIRRIRMMAFRAQQHRNGSVSSLSSEYDEPKNGYKRRGSAPEWDHMNRVLLAQNSSLTHSHTEWGNSSLGIDQLHPFDIAKHLLDGMSSRRQSLPTSTQKWGEITMTMEVTTSMEGTTNGPRRKFKVILLGDCGVGKSSYLLTLLNGKYTESMPNTNMTTANAVKTFLYKGHEVELNFFDTAGQEKYRSMTASYYRHAQGCLMFFNVNYKHTFDHIESWLDDLTKYGSRDNMAIVLVGLTHKHAPKHRQDNREDNYDNFDSRNTATCNMRAWSDLDVSINKRAVPRGQAEHLASNRSIPYMEADIRSDPNAVLRIIDKLLEVLMYRVVQVNDSIQLSTKLSKNSKHHSDNCSCKNIC